MSGESDAIRKILGVTTGSSIVGGTAVAPVSDNPAIMALTVATVGTGIAVAISFIITHFIIRRNGR